MDKSTFHMEINKIVAEHRLDQHSFVKSVNQGKAAREQLKGYPIQHYETDKEHGEGGHRMIDRFVTGTGREEEFLAEARTLAKFFWKGFDSMMTA